MLQCSDDDAVKILSASALSSIHAVCHNRKTLMLFSWLRALN